MTKEPLRVSNRARNVPGARCRMAALAGFEKSGLAPVAESARPVAALGRSPRRHPTSARAMSGASLQARRVICAPWMRGAPSAGSLSGVRVPKRLTPHVHSLVDDEKRYRAGGAGVPPQLLDGRASARTGTRVDVRSLCEARTGESGHHAESHLHIPLAAR